jgi:hypothetical protein
LAADDAFSAIATYGLPRLTPQSPLLPEYGLPSLAPWDHDLGGLRSFPARDAFGYEHAQQTRHREMVGNADFFESPQLLGREHHSGSTHNSVLQSYVETSIYLWSQ